MTIISQLDSPLLQERLAALEQLCALERAGQLDPAVKIGPVLPSYDHVHTMASYGHAAPGVHSAARMAWAAHEARAYSILRRAQPTIDGCKDAESQCQVFAGR
jgi:hypothetical protein